MKSIIAVLMAVTLVVPSVVLAVPDDAYHYSTTGTQTVFGSLTPLLSGIGLQSEYIASAKVIVENQSSGVRAVQCRITVVILQGGGAIDYANTILGPGESVTLPLQLAKTGSNIYHPAVHCHVYSAQTSGVIAGWVRLTQHSANVSP